MFDIDTKTIIDLYVKGLSETKDSALAMLEQSIGSNVAKQVNQTLRTYDINSDMALASVGAILVGCAEEGNIFDATMGRILIRGSISNIVNTVRRALHSDLKIEKALKEGGAFHGITDPVLLVQQVAAMYAANAAKCSRFSAYVDDDDDDDSYRFNAPGAEGVTCTLDLANLDKLEDKQITITVAAGNKYNVDACRARLELDSGTIIESPNTPEYKAKLAIGNKKHLFDAVWPLNVYDASLSTGMCKEYILDETPIPYKSNGKDMSFTRKSLHEKLTDVLNSEISPLLLQTGSSYNYPNIAVFDGKPVFVHPSFYTVNPNGAVVSVYSAGRLANDYRFNVGAALGVVGSEDMLPEVTTEAKIEAKEATPAVKDDRKFPISKDSCKQADGKYECPRCHSIVKKNQFNAWLPKSLDEAVADESVKDADMMEANKWAGSAICGTCSDQLKKVREKFSAKFLKENKAFIEASKEVEAMEAAWVEADDQRKTAEAKLAELDAAVKTLGNKVPDVVKKAHEEARFNVQTALGAVACMKTKLDEACNKRNALHNGTATPVAKSNTTAKAIAPAPVATPTKAKAVVIKAAEPKMNRKERRAAERAARAANRKSNK